MEKLIEKMSKIPHDKLLHSFYGMLIWILASSFDMYIGICVVVGVAVIREVLNKKFDVMDIIWTIALPSILFVQRVVLC
jgi:hypothetical protein